MGFLTQCVPFSACYAIVKTDVLKTPRQVFCEEESCLSENVPGVLLPRGCALCAPLSFKEQASLPFPQTRQGICYPGSLHLLFFHLEHPACKYPGAPSVLHQASPLSESPRLPCLELLTAPPPTPLALHPTCHMWGLLLVVVAFLHSTFISPQTTYSVIYYTYCLPPSASL